MKKQPEMTEKTRQKLIDAFWALALDENSQHLTASGVAKQAGVNRSTFYEYFLDIVDLTEAAEEQFLHDFVQQIEARVLPKLPMSLSEFSAISLGIFPLYADKMFYLLGESQSRTFETKMRERMMPYLLQLTGLQEETTNLAYVQTFMLSAIRGIFMTWYEEGKKVPIEDLLPMGQKLVAEGVLGYAESLR